MLSTTKQLKPFSEFVGALYKPQNEASLRQTISTGILKIIPGINAGASVVDPSKEAILRGNTAYAVQSGFYDSWNSNFRANPIYLLPRKKSHHETVLSDCICPVPWHRNALYSETFRPESFEDMITCLPGMTDSLCMDVAVFRERRGFHARDRITMNLLIPHFSRAFKNAAFYSPLHTHILLTPFNTSARENHIFLDRDQKILHCSEAAHDLLVTFFEHSSIPAREIPASLKSWLDKPEPYPLRKKVCEEILEVHFHRNPETGHYVITPQTSGPLSSSIRLESLGISSREAEVLYWIAQGKRNAEIGIILNMSVFTVKNHIKQIFASLYVETRTAAGAMALTCLNQNIPHPVREIQERPF